jgi:putative FmdB family regulatory protein
MPLYEYKCTQCGRVVEALQKAKDRPLEKCPNCGGRLRKVISPPAIQFKGNGWYVTDYARKNAPAPNSNTEPKTAPKAEAGGEKKGPEKPPPAAED